MSDDRSHVARNEAERRRLEALAHRLTDDDLRRPLADGSTVSAALAHLAFWDRETLAALARWEREPIQGPASGPADWDAANEARLAEWLATPPRAALEAALAAAEAVDRTVASIAPELAEAILASGRPRALDRSFHRRLHLDQIEQALRS